MANENARILIVDDNPDICEILCRLVKREGHEASAVYDGEAALKKLAPSPPDLIFADLKLPGMDGYELLNLVKDADPDLPVVIITGYADVPGAVAAMRLGSHDYLAKPFDNHEVIRVLRRALAERNLKRQIRGLSLMVEGLESLREMMGPSDVVKNILSQINCVAGSNFSVMITGETGTGKELVGKFIHQVSPRARKPFVPVDCGAIPETLFENELFGHESGSFTDAKRQVAGKFEVAQGGVLFLDEITNLHLGSQAKLLRAIQHRKIFRVGGTKDITMDVRILAASNQSLEEAVSQGSFRQDLFFRLNEFMIRIPPLRDRKGDILYLAKRFLDKANVELNKNVKGFSEPAVESLMNYNWPGNVRELRSTVRRAALLADEMISTKHLDLEKSREVGSGAHPQVPKEAWDGSSLKEIVRHKISHVEREIIKKVLERTGGNKAQAARWLKIDYKTMHNKVKAFGLSDFIDGGHHDKKKR